MTFPDVQRVIYERNPLNEVVCQLRFPRILVLDEHVPAEFQQELGSEYPHIETRETATVVWPGQSAPTAASRLALYDFFTPDRDVVITVCSEFIAFKTTKYVKWEDFRAHISKGVSALMASYSIKNFTRIGLRYVNTLDRTALGLREQRWSDLVRNSTLGLLGDQDVNEADVWESFSSVRLRLQDGFVLLQTGILSEPNDGSPKYVIDADFFCEQAVESVEDAFRFLASFNRSARNAFRWSIRDALHRALRPIQA